MRLRKFSSKYAATLLPIVALASSCGSAAPDMAAAPVNATAETGSADLVPIGDEILFLGSGGSGAPIEIGEISDSGEVTVRNTIEIALLAEPHAEARLFGGEVLVFAAICSDGCSQDDAGDYSGGQLEIRRVEVDGSGETAVDLPSDISNSLSGAPIVGAFGSSFWIRTTLEYVELKAPDFAIGRRIPLELADLGVICPIGAEVYRYSSRIIDEESPSIGTLDETISVWNGESFTEVDSDKSAASPGAELVCGNAGIAALQDGVNGGLAMLWNPESGFAVRATRDQLELGLSAQQALLNKSTAIPTATLNSATGEISQLGADGTVSTLTARGKWSSTGIVLELPQHNTPTHVMTAMSPKFFAACATATWLDPEAIVSRDQAVQPGMKSTEICEVKR